MDYEKKYKEALERAKTLQKTCDSQSVVGWCEYLFPELKESEDERMRKTIIEFIKNIEEENESPLMFGNTTTTDMLAWLEKQGEPTEINPSEFDLRLNKLLKQFESLPKEELISNLSYYLNIIQNNGTYKIEKQGEKKSITIDADPIASYDNVMISDIKDEGIDNISPEGSVNCVVTNSNKQGEQKLNPCNECINIKGCINCENGELNETEQKPMNNVETLFKVGDIIRLKDGDGLEWTVEEVLNNGYYTIVCADRDDFIQLDDKWELVGQKPTWSEEEEVKINRIVACLENLNVADNDILLKDVDWLKSLKGRVQPKKEWSEEDEAHINGIIDYLFDYKLLVYEEDMNVANGVQKELDWLETLKQRIGG